jgi:pimeloyl-ACP methyl ester carboxylesterase
MLRIAFKLLAGFLVIITLVTIGVVASYWAPDRSVAALSARWAMPPSTFVSVMGMEMHVRDEGPREDAVPIVLLHGTSASLHTWDGWVAGLKATRRVIRMDLPAFGLTGPFPQPDSDYSVDRYATFMRAFLDRMGVTKCVLVGNSFGGHVALATTLANPARVERLVLIDSAGYPMAPASIPLGFRIARIPLLNQFARVTLPRSIVAASVQNVYGDAARVTPEVIDRYYELTLREGNRAALGERIKHIETDVMATQIPSIKAPTLILWGGRDRLIPLDAGKRFANDIAGSRLIVFDDLGHVPHEEDPARTLAAAKDFLFARN